MTPVYLFPPRTRWRPGRRGTQRAQILRYCKCSVTISFTTVRDKSGHCSYTSLIVKCRFSLMMRFTVCFNASVMTVGRPDLSASWTSVRPFLYIVHHFRTLAAFITCSSQTATSLRWISLGLTFSSCKNRITPRTSQLAGFDIGAFIVTTRYTHNVKKSSLRKLHRVTIYTLLNTPNDWSRTMKNCAGCMRRRSYFPNSPRRMTMCCHMKNGWDLCEWPIFMKIIKYILFEKSF